MADADHLTADHVGPQPALRWSPRRKAVLILALDYGLFSLEEACGRFALSAEELAAWRRDVGRHGIPGLRSTRVQIYRDT